MADKNDFSNIGANAKARAVRDLKKQNGVLKKMAVGHAAEMRKAHKRMLDLVSIVSDFRSAAREWMPMLRHTDNETAQSVAAAMRKLMDEVEGRLNG
jgi:succinyl-CoA synthetase alpha subunit